MLQNIRAIEYLSKQWWSREERQKRERARECKKDRRGDACEMIFISVPRRETNETDDIHRKKRHQQVQKQSDMNDCDYCIDRGIASRHFEDAANPALHS